MVDAGIACCIREKLYLQAYLTGRLRTLVTYTLSREVHLLYLVPFRHTHGRYTHVIQAVGLAADRAAEVYVVVVMLVLAAGLLAEGILYGSASVVDAVQQPLLLERVQGAVKRHAVVLTAKLLFNGRMRQRVFVLQKQMQHIGTALGFAQPVGMEDLMEFVHAGIGIRPQVFFQATHLMRRMQCHCKYRKNHWYTKVHRPLQGCQPGYHSETLKNTPCTVLADAHFCKTF